MIEISDTIEGMIGQVVAQFDMVENGISKAIGAARIRVDSCANSTPPVKAVDQAIAEALELGDEPKTVVAMANLVEILHGYSHGSPKRMAPWLHGRCAFA